jgi:hypothetical protein
MEEYKEPKILTLSELTKIWLNADYVTKEVVTIVLKGSQNRSAVVNPIKKWAIMSNDN